MKSIFQKILNTFILLVMFSATGNAQQLFVSDNNRFAFELYQILNTQNDSKNLFYSPYSISEALAMVYQGAEGNTRAEMQQVFHFNDDKATLTKQFAENRQLLWQQLDSVTLVIANSLWLQQKYSLVPEYPLTLQNHYNASVKEVNFLKTKTRKKAVESINSWVYDNTQHEIDQIITKDDVTEDTRLILVNALYFFGAWQKAFSNDKTQQAPFYSNSGEQPAMFMTQMATIPYYSDDMIQALQLSYAGGNQSMLILLPNDAEAMKHLDENMESEYINTIIKDLSDENFTIRIPRFSAEFSTNLANVLQSMGMHEAFTDNANFTSIVANNELKVDKILHKARIEVTEEGTKAAAATAVTMIRKTAFLPTREFYANRPFVYLIRDNTTGTILFMGKLNQVR